jgi:non-specific serine/threonine protein kinase
LLARDSHPSRSRLEALCTDAHLTNGNPANVGVIDRMLDEADAVANDLADASGSADVSQVRGLAMLFRSRPDSAVQLFESAAEGHRAVGDRGAVAYDLVMLATAKIVSANSDGLRAIIDECLAMASAADENWTQASALWALGVEMCKQGDFAGAFAAQRRSIELRMPLEARYLIALNLDVLAWLAVRQSDCERAGRLFGAADAIMQDLGGSLVSRGPTSGLHNDYMVQASRELGPTEFRAAFDVGLRMDFDDAIAYALGSAAKAAPEVIATGSSPASAALTRREFEVAQLVARGLTNKQIGAALVIAQRTAEGHVEHVLTKLGFTTRAQIATWMAEQISSDSR